MHVLQVDVTLTTENIPPNQGRDFAGPLKMN